MSTIRSALTNTKAAGNRIKLILPKVSSVHLSPTIQNVTFTVNIQTFNDSSKFWFDIKDRQYVKFNGDPKLEEPDSNPMHLDIYQQ